MNRRPHPFTVLLTALALAASGSLASPRSHGDEGRGKSRDRDRGERVERPKARISLDQAVSMAERRFNARVVRAESREQGGRVVYVLRLLAESGRVWTVKVDAVSGDMR